MDLAMALSIIAMVMNGITLCFLITQTRAQVKTTNNQIYQNFVTNSTMIDNALMEHPECRKYIYGNAEIPEDETERALILSIAELSFDIIENVREFIDYIPKDRVEGWLDFVKDVQSSSGYKFFESTHSSWYNEKDMGSVNKSDNES